MIIIENNESKVQPELFIIKKVAAKTNITRLSFGIKANCYDKSPKFVALL